MSQILHRIIYIQVDEGTVECIDLRKLFYYVDLTVDHTKPQLADQLQDVDLR